MLVHMVLECSAVRLLLLHTLTCIGSFNVWLCIGRPLGCSTMCFYTGNRIDASVLRKNHDPYIPVHIERIIIMTVQYDLDIYTQSRLTAVSAIAIDLTPHLLKSSQQTQL